MSETRSWYALFRKLTINHGFCWWYLLLFYKISQTQKMKCHWNEHLDLIPWYFVVESICSCSRNYMSICINCHHSNCVMVQITNPLVLSGRLFKYVCTWVVRATTFLRIWTDILQNRLFLKYAHICSKTISLKNMKYWYVA